MATRTGPPQTPDVAFSDSSFFGHPRGLATLFFLEMWERFSYYGMRALLILFMTATVAHGGLGFPDSKAGTIYGGYTASVFLLSLPGGWLADRVLGQRRAVLYGGILIAIGEFCLMSPGLTGFYAGLALLILGTGLLKPNVSTIVGQIYSAEDTRRDSGFSIFYMGINVGALLSPLICGWVGERISWRLGFGVAGLGMLAGIVQYLLGGKYLGEAGLNPVQPDNEVAARKQRRNVWIGAGGMVAAFAVLALLGATGAVEFTAEGISNWLGVLLVVASASVFAWLLFGAGWTPVERKRSAAILVLFLASMIFWAGFEQAGSSLNLFAERNTDRTVFGFNFPASWFQFVQPLFVIALAPVFAWIWLKMGRHEPSSPTKFSIGLLFGGLAFALMVPAAGLSGHGVLVSSWWLTGNYFLATLGELCLSPVGLSAMTKLAPARVGSLVMGVWFLSISIGDYLAGKAASVYDSMALPTLFGTVAGLSIMAAVLLALVIRPTVRMMSGIK